ncbi:MAG: hypothetical protein DMF49_12805 [Acidobacteria bacterium]|nr:MAG: hypothetical protein DMF49_12805 [Acidobacteriota bacterium]
MYGRKHAAFSIDDENEEFFIGGRTMKSKRFTIPILLASALAAVSLAEARHLRRAPSPAKAEGFVDEVTNKFFPLRPGTTFHYEGTSDGVPVSDDMTVTHDIKVILGVSCTVVQDRAYENGIQVEDTFDWYAQDLEGNVWYFGEDTRQLDPNGNVIGTEGSWEAGVNGAQQGIIMEANPGVGDRYQQELAPGVAEDLARVSNLNKTVCVPYGCFDDVLKTREWSTLEKNVVENKYYAENVGDLLEVMVKGGDERIELKSISHEP